MRTTIGPPDGVDASLTPGDGARPRSLSDSALTGETYPAGGADREWKELNILRSFRLNCERLAEFSEQRHPSPPPPPIIL